MTARRRILLVAAALVASLIVAPFVAPETLWHLVGGPADQGPVDLATLERRATPNDALVCPDGGCRAQSDFPAPRFDVPPAALFARLVDEIEADPEASIVARDDDALSLRAVYRSPLMGFPDTVQAEVLPAETGATLRLYSRSLIGRSDLGANAARLRRLIDALARALPALSTASIAPL